MIGGMSRGSLIAAIGNKGETRYADEFDALRARWLPISGTLAVNSGALRAATLGDWLGNKVTNGEFTTNTAGWVASYSAVLTRRDLSSAPDIDPTGGADNFGLEVASGGNLNGTAQWYPSVILGTTYVARAMAYAPSSNVAVNAHRMDWAANGTQYWALGTTEDVWQPLEKFVTYASGGFTLYLFSRSATAGDVAYYDYVRIYRQNSIALLSGWRSPNLYTVLSHISPATGVVPFSFIFRYVDALNYNEIRLIPNLTAGDDVQMWRVTAGVETQLLGNYVGLTSGGTDEVAIQLDGPRLNVGVKKSGASVFTPTFRYDALSQGLTSRNHGIMLWETGINRLGRIGP